MVEEKEAQAEEKTSKEQFSLFTFLFETVKFAVIALLIVIPFRIYIAQPYIVSGASMEETFKSGTYLIVDQFTYRFDEPERGDVIIFRLPQDPSKFLIKRVIGLPGETVKITQGEVTITKPGTEPFTLAEPYVVPDNFMDIRIKTLKDTEYFVMGDNRPESLDSRIWGPLPQENIIGEAFFALFPLNDMALHPGRHSFEEITP
ncbi:MAG: signal peptidase I [Parcubacteria group bacterium]|nr:signal peptidase I [Parcubacteria group bacterium]